MDDLYLRVSEASAKNITETYSTSFGMASTLFHKSIRQDIYNVYGYVRIADEIVDTYTGGDALQILDELEQQTYRDLKRGYSSNPVVHAFVHTCNKFGITKKLIAPFMASMRMDANNSYTTKDYQEYIYGSAEVVGLMCLRVFCQGDDSKYKQLEKGARALGSAFQKVNFLRDLADDQTRLGRYYFPKGSFQKFDEKTKQLIVEDIASDFEVAQHAIERLPANSKKAVNTAYQYFYLLLSKLRETPAATLKQQRVRLSNAQKLTILVKSKVGRR